MMYFGAVGCGEACVQHAAEGQERKMFGSQPSLLALGLGSLDHLSSLESLEQQRRL